MPVSGGFQVPSDPHLRRWMLFIDGENFTMRAQKLAQANNVTLSEGSYYLRDVFIWLPGVQATQDTTQGHLRLQPHAIRSFYYTSVPGDEQKLLDAKQRLRNLGFNPHVFKKTKDKSKGVDVALSKDLLVNAFFDNYDVAVLIAGDGDYVPLIEEVKRRGKVVYLAFFKDEGLNQDLWMAADSFFETKQFFVDSWNRFNREAKENKGECGSYLPTPQQTPRPPAAFPLHAHLTPLPILQGL